MGLDWMQQTGIPNIENNIQQGSSLVILMGVNDLYQANNYISYLNSNATSWKNRGANIYFVSVNPTEGSYNSLNTDIDSFNQRLRAGLTSNITYIDTNSYLKSNGFRWSKYNKCWYIKDSKEARDFLKSLGYKEAVENQQIKIDTNNIDGVYLPLIDINDIESYTI